MEFIDDIINLWMKQFGKDESVLFNVPAPIQDLMTHWTIISHAISTRAPVIPFDTLTETDRETLDTLVPFVQAMFKRYGGMWLQFSKMENKPVNEQSANEPHLVIADLELKSLQSQYPWTSDPTPDSPSV